MIDMKKILVLIILGCLSQFAIAQPFYKDLRESGLIGNVKTVTEYTYHGRTGAAEVNMNQTPSKTITDFDKNGRKLDETRLTYEGILISKFQFNYSDPKKIAIIEYWGQTKLTTKYSFNYDNNDRVIGFYQYPPKIDSAVFSVIYKYDDGNNIVGDNTYVAGKYLASTTKSRFNDKNQKIETKSYDPHDKLISTISFEYNQTGVLTRQSTMPDTSSMIQNNETIEYSNPDKYGNFLSGLYTNNSNLFGEKIASKKIIRRTILYYSKN